MQELLNKIRPVTEEDREKLPKVSYSALEVLKNCPLQFKFKYRDKKYTDDTSLALELGSLCHYVLEQKGKALVEGKTVDYQELFSILENGVITTDEKNGERIAKETLFGTDLLKGKYFETWYEKDNASGMTYNEKMDIFEQVLYSEMEDNIWVPTYFELPFEFVYDNRIIFHGFIDRIDIHSETGEYRTVDYKTSKKTYENSKLVTSLQFGIYALAILSQFNKVPTESMYRFILIDQTQYALTKGWEKRLIKALDKLLDQINENDKSSVWEPKPSPLCHWCNFCRTNPNAVQYRNDCEYFSLWMPNKKSFEVNKKWDPNEVHEPVGTPRKLIF